MKKELPNKAALVDTAGRPITQSLFLELGYSDLAVYTLKDEDYDYNDKYYFSIKRLYLEKADPTEYEFASEYLLGWKHWMRICQNKAIARHVEEWREELEVKLRSQGVKHLLQSAKTGNYQAAKWIADRGWDTRGAGRPSKSEIEKEKRIQERISDEYGADIHRLFAQQ